MAQAKKVLVIGGSGFLGSHVADALSDSGYKVTVFDHRESFYLRPDQEEIIGDILDSSAVQNAVAGHDIVYHFAGIADIDECDKRPLDTVRFNILGTTYVLEACVKHNVERLVFASSAYVYSNAGSFYRTSKQACENIIEAYKDKYGPKYVILRYGSLYGPRSDRRNSLYRICEQALTKHEITYGGMGDEKREFIHVFDASNMSVKILSEEFVNQSIILTGDASIRYDDLLAMISEMLHNRVEIKYVPKTSETHYKQSPYAFSPKFGKKLSTNPRVDLGQGLLNLMGEIHEKLHPELQEKFGLLIGK